MSARATTATSSPTLSEGARLLARRAPVDVAARIGASEAAARAWKKGERVPSGPARRALRGAYEIPIDAWDRPAEPANTTTTKATRARPATALTTSRDPATAAAGVRAQIAQLEADIAAAKKSKATPREIASLHGALTGALRLLARVGGEAAVTEQAILRSAPWRRVMRAIEDVLEAHPQIAREIAIAIEKCEREGGA